MKRSPEDRQEDPPVAAHVDEDMPPSPSDPKPEPELEPVLVGSDS